MLANGPAKWLQKGYTVYAFDNVDNYGALTWWGPDPNISGFETSGHIDHQMSSPVGHLAMIVRLADSLIICCHFDTIVTVFL